MELQILKTSLFVFKLKSVLVYLDHDNLLSTFGVWMHTAWDLAHMTADLSQHMIYSSWYKK